MIFHPTDADLSSLALASLGERKRGRLLWHLANCAICRRRHGELLGASAQSPAPKAIARPPEGTRGQPNREPVNARSYDEVLSKNYELLLAREARFRREVASAPALFQELQRHPPRRREVLVSNVERFRTWGLVEHLLHQAAQAWFEEPRQGIDLASLALSIASQLDETEFGVALLSDLKARCWIHLANTHRILAQLPAAEAGFSEAQRLLEAGTDDPMERANFLGALGRLRMDQRRYPDAEAVLQRATTLYKRLRDRHLVGRTLVTLANVFTHAGEPLRALATLQRALDHIEIEREPRLALYTRHNLVIMLCDAGRFMEARSWLARSRELYERFGSALMRLQHAWAQGKIALGLRQHQQAVHFLERARSGFLETGRADDAAVISLELALAHLELGEREKVERLAGEALETFRTLDIPREVFASLLLLAEAARNRRLTVALLTEMLRRVQVAPAAPSERADGAG